VPLLCCDAISELALVKVDVGKFRYRRMHSVLFVKNYIIFWVLHEELVENGLL